MEQPTITEIDEKLWDRVRVIPFPECQTTNTEPMCETCHSPDGFHDLKCGISSDHDDEQDDEPDIVEEIEMTEEAQHAIATLFAGCPPEKLDIAIREDGGVSVIFTGVVTESPNTYNLIISGSGKRYILERILSDEALASQTDEQRAANCRTFSDASADGDTLEGIIKTEFGRYDAKKDLAAPIVIKLKKGFDQIGMRKFIKKIDVFLVSRKGLPTSVKVTTEDWARNTQHFVFINAAKKMFARYAEQGLLAVLTFNGFLEAANQMYCIAYVKGKPKAAGVEFKNIDPADFKRKLLISTMNLHKYSRLDLEDGGSDDEDADLASDAPITEEDKAYIQNLVNTLTAGAEKK